MKASAGGLSCVAAAAAALGGLLLGCTSSRHPAARADASVVVATAAAVTVIGSPGGTVTAPGGASVTIPAGALSSDTTITIIASPSTVIPGDITAVDTAEVFGPEGLTFAVPVVVTLPFQPSRIPSGLSASDVQIFTAPVGGFTFTELASTAVDATHVSAPTTHFSTFVGGTTTDKKLAYCLPPAILVCGTQCVDPVLDPDHCGAGGRCDRDSPGAPDFAGFVCNVGAGQTCQGGICACPHAGDVVCGGTCIDPATSNGNCGANGSCSSPTEGSGNYQGVACDTNALQACSGGVCGCVPGAVVCAEDGNPNHCIDPMTSSQFCGADSSCGGYQDCTLEGPGEGCVKGVCTECTGGGYLYCDGTCVAPTSTTHCGATGNCIGATPGAANYVGAACGPGYACTSPSEDETQSCQSNLYGCGVTEVGGPPPEAEVDACNACALAFCDCLSGLTCGAAATDGGTGTACCATGQVCADGECVPPCTTPQIACGGACVDPSTSTTNCGATAPCSASPGVQCAAGQGCTNGACVPVCPSHEILCDGQCINPSTSATHCGATAPCDSNPGAACFLAPCVNGACYYGPSCTAADAGCPTVPPLLPETAAGVYCPSASSGPDAGPAVVRCSAAQVCCEPTEGTGASTCKATSASCATGDVVWECTEAIDCTGNPAGSVCCGTGTLTTEPACGCNPAFSSVTSGFTGTVCATSCSASQYVVCEKNGDCAAGQTCIPTSASGGHFGHCS